MPLIMRLSPALKIIAQALLLAGVLLGFHVWQVGWQSPWRFDLAWDEEVQLHDQRIILVHIQRSYERNSLLTRAGSVRVATAVSFDAGPPFGHVSHLFGPDVALIDQHLQGWYFVAAPAAAGQRQVEQALVFWTLRPGDSLRLARPGERLPDSFTHWNVMPATPDATTLAKFDNTRLELGPKMRHWAAHPRGDIDEVIRLGPPGTGPAASQPHAVRY